MKNFKKVLALVLVLATLLGLATMASATEYKDADKIAADYDEAVKVLDLIETMQGYPNGEFRPTANITREEAAKLIAIFDNKDADISTYYTSINPFADEKGRWGESYVGYGYRAGIIAGMNANTFAPTANVTGTQFLKMALVTLGYDQEAEGFVGSSWAVNVLSLARKLDLIDGLADGWKAEKDLTREEAAQILLNTLQADTVEYAQEAKSANWKPTEKDGVITFGGKLYLTVAGAVKTGEKLYKDFKLAKETSYDAFERPYTKWIYDNDNDKTVEQMKAPKATFTTKFNACELLVALGVKESDTKTEKVVAEYYVNGELISNDRISLKHTASKCELKTDEYEKYGAQGTLTQVFAEKDDDGKTVYRICSIDTWLGKLAKVTKTTTSRDNHKKGEDLVQIVPFTVSNDGLDSEHNYSDYCNDMDDYHPWQCGNFKYAGETSKGEEYVTYDKPAGLAKDDYVLFTYSFKQDDNEDMGVQSVDVVTAKEGRLNGFKYADVADDPSETRIGGEYVKDAAHFHLGYDESKDTANFGTRGFFYDAYGNVIGMKDAADVSKYGVLDKAWVEYSKGVASIHANIVGLDAKVIEDVVVVEFNGINNVDNEDWEEKFGATLADLVDYFGHQGMAEGSLQNYKTFYMLYDYLGKYEVNTKGEYKLSRDEDNYKRGDDEVTFVKGKPVLKGVYVGGKEVKVTANTEFLVRTDDVGTGSYVSWKGYTGENVKSVVAQGYDVVMDDDGEYAEVVYLYDIVGFNDGKFVAYVPANANIWREEVTDDGDIYYILEAYVNGVKTELKISDTDKDTIDRENGTGDGVHGNFFEFRYREIGEVNTAKLTENPNFNLVKPYEVASYKDGVLELTSAYDNGETIIALAKDCVIYSIQSNGTVAKEEKGLEYAADYIDEGDSIYMDWNDKNDDGENQVFALYVVENEKD